MRTLWPTERDNCPKNCRDTGKISYWCPAEQPQGYDCSCKAWELRLLPCIPRWLHRRSLQSHQQWQSVLQVFCLLQDIGHSNWRDVSRYYDVELRPELEDWRCCSIRRLLNHVFNVKRDKEWSQVSGNVTVGIFACLQRGKRNDGLACRSFQTQTHLHCWYKLNYGPGERGLLGRSSPQDKSEWRSVWLARSYVLSKSARRVSWPWCSAHTGNHKFSQHESRVCHCQLNFNELLVCIKIT